MSYIFILALFYIIFFHTQMCIMRKVLNGFYSTYFRLFSRWNFLLQHPGSFRICAKSCTTRRHVHNEKHDKVCKQNTEAYNAIEAANEWSSEKISRERNVVKVSASESQRLFRDSMRFPVDDSRVK